MFPYFSPVLVVVFGVGAESSPCFVSLGKYGSGVVLSLCGGSVCVEGVHGGELGFELDRIEPRIHGLRWGDLLRWW